jgi:hypothetical protein
LDPIIFVSSGKKWETLSEKKPKQKLLGNMAHMVAWLPSIHGGPEFTTHQKMKSSNW